MKASNGHRQEVEGDDNEDGEDKEDNEDSVSQGTLSEDSLSDLSSSESRSSCPAPPLPCVPRPSRPAPKKLKKNMSLEIDYLIAKYLESRIDQPSAEAEHDDGIEKFLLSMAPTLQKMPERVLADVKFKIHKVIHQAGMETMYTPEPLTQLYIPVPTMNNSWSAPPHQPSTTRTFLRLRHPQDF